MKFTASPEQIVPSLAVVPDVSVKVNVPVGFGFTVMAKGAEVFVQPLASVAVKVISVEPTATPETKPPLLTVAKEGADDNQLDVTAVGEDVPKSGVVPFSHTEGLPVMPTTGKAFTVTTTL